MEFTPLYHVRYLVLSTNEWFKNVSNEILPNTYILNLIRFDEKLRYLEFQGTKNKKTQIIAQDDLIKVVKEITTFTFYNN